MKILFQLLREFWLPLLLDAAWTAFNVLGRPCGSGGGRTRSAVAANVTGTGGQRSDLARRGARYSTAAAEQGANDAQQEDGHSGRQAAWTEIQ